MHQPLAGCKWQIYLRGRRVSRLARIPLLECECSLIELPNYPAPGHAYENCQWRLPLLLPPQPGKPKEASLASCSQNALHIRIPAVRARGAELRGAFLLLLEFTPEQNLQLLAAWLGHLLEHRPCLSREAE